MKNSRRDFLKLTGMAGLGLAGAGMLPGCNSESGQDGTTPFAGVDVPEQDSSIIGIYGHWGSSLLEEPPAYSFRNDRWSDLDRWRKEARNRLSERLAIPDMGGVPDVTVHNELVYDGLHIEELSWDLPYGRTTEALFLKPQDAQGPLPGVLAFYDHGLQKYFGTLKISRTSDEMHPILEAHHRDYYEGRAWANELAKRGYAVLVADVFPFGSRRVKLANVPQPIREIWPDLEFEDPGSADYINAYNQWAAQHEHIMAKSLFSAGTTWPGVFVGEDRKALDVLCNRKDVDETRVGCSGLSGGGIRTTYTAGLDPRVKCAVCVAFQTTWQDLVVHKSYTHTWMTFTPLLPNDMDFCEIYGLRAPQATLVLNNEDDPLFTLEEMERADEILREVFEKAGASDRYDSTFHPGPHKFDINMQEEAFDWFDRWLKA